MDSARPRLLVLASTFPRWQGDTEPRFVERLSYELAKSFDVVILAPHCAGAKRREMMTNIGQTIDVHRFRYLPEKMETLAYDGGMLSRIRRNPLRLLMLPFYLVAMSRSVARLQHQYQFDAVHAHWIVPQGVVAVMLRSWWRKMPPILVTSHGGDLYALRGKLLASLQRWVLERADAVTVVSAAMRDYCEKLGIAPERVIVRSMGVDLETTFTPTSGEPPRKGLVFVGRLVEKKGVAHLIEAMATLAQRYPDVRAQIVGDGPLRPSLEALAAKLAVADKVQFVGSVQNTEVPGYLRAAKIAVMPSVVASSGDQEGLGLVAVEALGCGCAVVAFDLPAIRDTIIDGQTGLMAEPGNADDLARKIALLLEDDSRRRQLANRGRRHAIDKFTWTAVGSEYVRIINEILDRTY